METSKKKSQIHPGQVIWTLQFAVLGIVVKLLQTIRQQEPVTEPRTFPQHHPQPNKLFCPAETDSPWHNLSNTYESTFKGKQVIIQNMFQIHVEYQLLTFRIVFPGTLPSSKLMEAVCCIHKGKHIKTQEKKGSTWDISDQKIVAQCNIDHSFLSSTILDYIEVPVTAICLD